MDFLYGLKTLFNFLTALGIIKAYKLKFLFVSFKLVPYKTSYLN